MGYSLSWLAVKGKPPQAVREQLGFSETGQREEFPESHLVAAELTGGWYLIAANDSERVISDDALQQVASGCEVVTCFVEEHVMFSYATAWEDGHRSWSVLHNGQLRRGHLDTSGKPPAVFDAILSRLQAKQQEADASGRKVDFVFDVPVELAQSLVGYRHDQDVPGMADKPFSVLARGGPIPGVAYSRFERWERKWMALAGWQRGVCGTLIVLAALAIILCLVTFLVMLFT